MQADKFPHENLRDRHALLTLLNYLEKDANELQLSEAAHFIGIAAIATEQAISAEGYMVQGLEPGSSTSPS